MTMTPKTTWSNECGFCKSPISTAPLCAICKSNGSDEHRSCLLDIYSGPNHLLCSFSFNFCPEIAVWNNVLYSLNSHTGSICSWRIPAFERLATFQCDASCKGGAMFANSQGVFVVERG